MYTLPLLLALFLISSSPGRIRRRAHTPALRPAVSLQPPLAAWCASSFTYVGHPLNFSLRGDSDSGGGVVVDGGRLVSVRGSAVVAGDRVACARGV
jgi:hypothetical protein